MKFVLFSHVRHRLVNGIVYAYGPYVREMNLWVGEKDHLVIVAPLHEDTSIDSIEISFHCKSIEFIRLPMFSLMGMNNFIKTLFLFPTITFQIFRGLFKPGHLHFRLPGNVGLIASILQVFFPKRQKSFKYAGNWDPKSHQPWSYQLQKWIVTNSFLTQNATVLVYGKSDSDPLHVTDFYTATYSESDKIDQLVIEDDLIPTFRFVFLGSLIEGKRPILAIQVIQSLHSKGIAAELLLCGDGPLKGHIQEYIEIHGLSSTVILKGSMSREQVDDILRNSHFLILPSKSEGWPKAVAEAMWWGCIPVSTPVSCVPHMLDYGNRGIIANPDVHEMSDAIIKVINDRDFLKKIRLAAMQWSHQYTLERMKRDISNMIR